MITKISENSNLKIMFDYHVLANNGDMGVIYWEVVW